MPFNTFGGQVSHPADVSYRAVALSANVTLLWPSLAETSTDVVANLMDVTPSAGSLSITMPDARQRSVGEQIIFRNLGASSFTVKDATGGTINTVATGVAIFTYLTSNATQAGSWGLVTFGTGTSAADAATLAGFGLVAITTTLNQEHDVAETSSNVTIAAADRAKTYVWVSGTVTCTLPLSSSIGLGFFFIAKNAGAGTITFTPSGADTIDGAASYQLAPDEGAIFYSGGSSNKWYTVAKGRATAFAFTQLIKSVAGGMDVTLTSAEAANKVITFTGLITANINVIVPNTVSVYYVFNSTTGAFTLTVKTAAGTGVTVAQGTRDILVCDATNVNGAVTNTAIVTAFTAGSEASPSITFVGDTDTGFYDNAANKPAVTAGGTDVMRWNTVASAVNAFDVFPSATTLPVTLTAFGGDANIGITIAALGTGAITLTGASLTIPALGADLKFTPDNTIDIGDPGDNRPRTIYVGTSIRGNKDGINIDCEQPTGVAAGGNLTLIAAAGGTTSGSGGNLTLLGGLPVDGDGGDVALQGRDAVGTTRAGGFVNLIAGNSTTAVTGGDIVITAGRGGATGTGGPVTINGGAGGTTSGAGGAVTVQGGSATDGDGGGVNITGRNATGTPNRNGGVVSIVAGMSTDAQTGALILITAGTGGPTGPGGGITMSGGVGGSTSGAGGAVTVQGGSATDGNGGAVNVTGRNATGTSRTGGSVVITAGTSTNAITGAAAQMIAGQGGPTGNGGTLSINGGAGGSTSGNGGVVNILGGIPTDGTGGGIAITARAGAGAASVGGNVTVTAGSSTAGGTGGTITLTSGAGGPTGVGGITNVVGGLGGSTSGAGGNVTITGGAPVGGGAGGYVILTGANATGAASGGGGVTLTAGNATGGTGGGTIQIDAGTGGSSSGVGGPVNITGGQGGVTANGGTVIITAGPGGSTNGTGGAATLQGGTATEGNGGAANLLGRTATGTSRSGGAVNITAGNSTTAIIGGQITLTPGQGGATGEGGALVLRGGAGGATSGAGGQISLLAGSATTSGSGGAVNINSGTAVGTGVGGSIIITVGTSVGAAAGSAFNATAGQGGPTGTGGDATITGGAGGSTSGQGGRAILRGGSTTSGVGGGILIQSRDAVGTNMTVASLQILAGVSTGSSSGGIVQIAGGTGGSTGTGGIVTITSGNGGSTSGASGTVNIESGLTTSGNTGAITLFTNSPAGTDKNSGAISLQTGAPTGAGISGQIFFATNSVIRMTILGVGTITIGDIANDVLFPGATIAQNVQNGTYGIVASDANKHIEHTSGSAHTWTIPANGSVAFRVGTAISFHNGNAAGIVSIAITTDTMRLAGPGTTGTRSLAANGIATALKVASTEWVISGTGLT